MTDPAANPASGGADAPMPQAGPATTAGPGTNPRQPVFSPASGAPSTDPVAPRPFALAALGLAALAALFVAEQRAGLGLALLGLGLVAAAWSLVESGEGSPPAADDRERRGDRVLFARLTLVAAAILAAVPAVRDSIWVTTLSLLGALTLASIAVARAATWRELGSGMVGWAVQLIPAPIVFGGQAMRRASSRRWTLAGPIARGALLALAFSLVFGALFSAADARFADLVSDLVDIDLDLATVITRLLVFGVVVSVAGALWLTAAHRRDRPGTEPTARLGRLEWTMALAALLVVFTAFVVLQLPVLFGGDELVQRTDGLTYASNARQGFVQLVAVAILTLGVVAVAAHRGPRGDLLVRLLSGALCLLTIVVLASALHRLGLYVDAYGQTRTRFSLTSLMFWLGVVMLLVVVLGGLRQTAWLPRAAVAVSACFAIGTVALNPDGRVAERNVQRYADTGRIDTSYLGSLSADAVPSLDALPEPARTCVLSRLAQSRLELDGNESLSGDSAGPASQNVSRARARRMVRDLPELRTTAPPRLACSPLGD